MQKYYNKKSRSPYLIDKSNNDSSKEQSITIDNVVRDQTLEKLILQMDQMRRKHEQEKRDMTEAFNYQVQQKTKHYQKLENEYVQKNQLLEQLLFQEQSKTIHLTRLVQEKQKAVAYDKEKETYRNKIQQLESILQESQKNNQKVPTKNKEQSYKILIDSLNLIQANVLKTAKYKKLNVSWMDYEILESDLSLSKDLPKSIQKLQAIFDNFFKQLQDSTTPSLSPYRVQTQNSERPVNTTIKKTIHNKLVNVSTQTKELYSKISKIQQTDINQQSQLIQTDDENQKITQKSKNTKINTQHQQTQTVSFANKTNKQTQFIIESRETLTQTEEIQINKSHIEKIITNDMQTQISQLREIMQQSQTTQTFISKFISTESQTDPLTRESLQQIEQQIKHHSKITEREEEEEEEEEEENQIEQKQLIKINLEDDEESVFDCNKPDYDSVIEHHEELVDLRKECEEKEIKIKKLERAFQQIILDQQGFQFDNLITSKQHSLQELITNKWTIKLKDHEAQQRYTIGIMGQDLYLIESIIQGIYNNQHQVKLDTNEVAIQYYDKNFVENYRLDLMFKRLQYPNIYLTNSKKVYEEQQFEMFWIDYMTTQCNQIIYLINDQCKYDIDTINYIKQKDKKIVIITFNDLLIEDFMNNNSYKHNEQYQIIKIQNNKDLINQLCQQILQSEWEWDDVQEQSLLSQFQSYLQPLVDNEDFMQLQIREDGIFEVTINSDEIRQNTLINIPYILNINNVDNKIEITMNIFENQEIVEVKCLEDQVLIIIDKYILLEQLGQKTKLERIYNNMIILQILQ